MVGWGTCPTFARDVGATSGDEPKLARVWSAGIRLRMSFWTSSAKRYSIETSAVGSFRAFLPPLPLSFFPPFFLPPFFLPFLP